MVNESWRKSSYSKGGMDNCVEARAAHSTRVEVRDSQHPGEAWLGFPAGEWAAFLSGVEQL
ncbi:DUF397 domain-containing protein [Lipingzhangella sp. LS1_29]|uniref:DUF397 domain-containing protein n=1 Tax=Lipingzhangella rawalii TaxID=2055835 RepID=A0ABU2H4U9_9ACTN|nr:DUF397 domain-containing protein [Lipingzhangella rawalii]MDS1270326.1 DUF397 domain-containing protein [Lipingzhangella rawalii]